MATSPDSSPVPGNRIRCLTPIASDRFHHALTGSLIGYFPYGSPRADTAVVVWDDAPMTLATIHRANIAAE